VDNTTHLTPYVYDLKVCDPITAYSIPSLAISVYPDHPLHHAHDPLQKPEEEEKEVNYLNPYIRSYQVDHPSRYQESLLA
jgi:hypothetical protein